MSGRLFLLCKNLCVKYCKQKPKDLEKTWFLGYNVVENQENSHKMRVIRCLRCCIFTDVIVEFNHQKQMQGGIDGKENDRQIHSRTAQGKWYDTKGTWRKTPCF